MAKKAAVVVDEVENVAQAEEEGLSNGLGLEALIPNVPKPKPEDEAPEDEPVGEDTHEEPDETSDEEKPKDDKKKGPDKDKKTGRFLKRKTDTPPVEDAHEDDDSETLKKRLKDTRDWATQVNQKAQASDILVKKLQADIAILTKKVEGTYVEGEEQKMDPVELARLTERTKISRAIAEQVYGPELVQELIFAENAPYRELEQTDPFVKAKVFGAEQPVMEAFRQLKWKHFHDQYGADPDDAYAKVRDEIRAEFVKSLKEKGRGKKTVDDMEGLTNMGGEGGRTDTHPKTGPINLAKVFTNFPTGSF